MDSERISTKLTAGPEEARLLETIDSDLRHALMVEPSPDFTARVHASIASDRTVRGSWQIYWGLAAAAALAAAVGLAVWVTHSGRAGADNGSAVARVTPAAGSHDVPLAAPPDDRSQRAAPGNPPVSASAQGTRGIPPVGRREVARGLSPDDGSRTNRNGGHVVVRSAARHAEESPAVIIDPRQREALDRLLALVRTGTTTLPRPLAAGADIATPALDLTVAAVVVEPLDVPQLPAGGGSPDTGAVRR